MADRAADAGRGFETSRARSRRRCATTPRFGRVPGEREVDRAAVGVCVREVRHHDRVMSDRGRTE
jgi:hypothetical protein